MFDKTFNIIPDRTSAVYAEGSYVVNVEPLEIKSENIGVYNETGGDSLKGKFRLMNGNIYKVVNDEPPVSELLRLAEYEDLKDAKVNL